MPDHTQYPLAMRSFEAVLEGWSRFLSSLYVAMTPVASLSQNRFRRMVRNWQFDAIVPSVKPLWLAMPEEVYEYADDFGGMREVHTGEPDGLMLNVLDMNAPWGLPGEVIGFTVVSRKVVTSYDFTENVAIDVVTNQPAYEFVGWASPERIDVDVAGGCAELLGRARGALTELRVHQPLQRDFGWDGEVTDADAAEIAEELGL